MANTWGDFVKYITGMKGVIPESKYLALKEKGMARYKERMQIGRGDTPLDFSDIMREGEKLITPKHSNSAEIYSISFNGKDYDLVLSDGRIVKVSGRREAQQIIDLDKSVKAVGMKYRNSFENGRQRALNEIENKEIK